MSRRLFNFSETLKTIYNNKLPLYIYLHPFYTLSNRPALSRLKKSYKKEHGEAKRRCGKISKTRHRYRR